MANNYTESSFMVTGTKEEIDILFEFVTALEDCLDTEDTNDWLADQRNGKTLNQKIVDAVEHMISNTDIIDWGSLGFNCTKESDNEAWFCHDESINPDLASATVQCWLGICDLDAAVSFTWSGGCSKPRVGEFSGGGCVVTKDAEYWTSGTTFVWQTEEGLGLPGAHDQMYGTDAERLAALEAFIDESPELKARLKHFLGKKHKGS